MCTRTENTKNNRKNRKSTRIIRSSEITVMMYAAGIPTLPSQKESVVQDKTLTILPPHARDFSHELGGISLEF